MKIERVPLAEDRRAWMDCYLQDPNIGAGEDKVRPAIIILPGGAYLKCARREAEPVAARFLGLGYQAFVVHYHTYLQEGEGGVPALDGRSHYPVQVIDAMRAVAYVRSHAREWCLDAERVSLMGFSAGAHIAGSLAERYDDPGLLEAAGAAASEVLPGRLLMCYPMITGNLARTEMRVPGGEAVVPREVLSMAVLGTTEPEAGDFDRLDLRRHVRSDMPPTFVWQTAADDTAEPIETIEFVAELRRESVPCEFHLFERGPHGMSLADDTSSGAGECVNEEASRWVELAASWLRLGRANGGARG